ncbi:MULTISPECIES: hypothetical protein [Brevibacterium]|uniref:hypothetical protein n=1 Tax=Brevibacterium TaxID=1696 RepID=UPI00142F4846|nr:hypothetical protein [Brevibacterium casei]NJE65778.1 hypothetical protein [Brevibacterium sp. LS14]
MKDIVESNRWTPPPLQNRAANVIRRFQEDIAEATTPQQKYLIARTALQDLSAAVADATEGES